MKCDSCQTDQSRLTPAIVENKFGKYCNDCLSPQKRMPNVGSAQYSRDRDREAHEMDMIQPWDAKGNPNREFIRRYPEEAKLNFSQEELETFG